MFTFMLELELVSRILSLSILNVPCYVSWRNRCRCRVLESRREFVLDISFWKMGVVGKNYYFHVYFLKFDFSLSLHVTATLPAKPHRLLPLLHCSILQGLILSLPTIVFIHLSRSSGNIFHPAPRWLRPHRALKLTTLPQSIRTLSSGFLFDNFQLSLPRSHRYVMILNFVNSSQISRFSPQPSGQPISTSNSLQLLTPISLSSSLVPSPPQTIPQFP